jgi:hypothetical protein
VDTPKARATGHINVTSYEAKLYDSAGAFTISEANILEEFSGELVGVGTVRFMMVNEPDGAVHFTGMERFLGKVGERSGSFIFQNSGELRAGVLHSTWHVIAGSGTEELTGICGKGGCDPAGYSFDYWFE